MMVKLIADERMFVLQPGSPVLLDHRYLVVLVQVLLGCSPVPWMMRLTFGIGEIVLAIALDVLHVRVDVL